MNKPTFDSLKDLGLTDKACRIHDKLEKQSDLNRKAKRILLDRMPQGITRLSLEFVSQCERQFHLGRLLSVSIVYEADLEWVTTLEYDDAVLKTDGFSVGYGGEGPCGLKQLLQDHGAFVEDYADPRNVHLVVGQSFRWPIGERA